MTARSRRAGTAYYHHVEHKNYSSVMAVPSDMYVAGYDSDGVSQLRLWQAKAPGFDMEQLQRGRVRQRHHQERQRRAHQQGAVPQRQPHGGQDPAPAPAVFPVCRVHRRISSRTHLSQYGTLENLPDKVAIHVNDTHPTLAIPELMRILLDECGYTWEKAFDITRRTFAYTNHTVMSEALEKWNDGYF